MKSSKRKYPIYEKYLVKGCTFMIRNWYASYVVGLNERVSLTKMVWKIL